MANSSTLTGKTAVVTGGASGIGLALVRYFAAHSCKIALLDISPPTDELLVSLQTEFPSSAFTYQPCDVSSFSAQALAFSSIHTQMGSIDIVCANAGVVEIGKFLSLDPVEPLEPNLKTLDVDLNGVLFSTKLAVHYMRKNTGKEKGLIVCTSSNAGLYPFPMAPLYAIAKHGIVGAVRSFAPLLQEEGIRINAVCPNCIATGIADDKLMNSMHMTPMSTLLKTIEEFCFNTSLSGITAEVSGEKFTLREPPEFVDEISRENIAMFSKLGYA